MIRQHNYRMGLLAGGLLYTFGAWLSAGFAGVLLGLGVAAAPVLLRVPYPSVLGQIGIIGISPTLSLNVLVAELGVAVMLATQLAAPTAPRWGIKGAGVFVAVVAVSEVLIQVTSVAVTASVVIGACTVVLYGIHRYERVVLGLAE